MILRVFLLALFFSTSAFSKDVVGDAAVGEANKVTNEAVGSKATLSVENAAKDSVRADKSVSYKDIPFKAENRDAPDPAGLASVAALVLILFFVGLYYFKKKVKVKGVLSQSFNKRMNVVDNMRIGMKTTGYIIEVDQGEQFLVVESAAGIALSKLNAQPNISEASNSFNNTKNS